MRKIEQQMNEAILNRKDFFKGNTSVQNYTTETGAREAVVHLHGNHIATVGDTLQICDAGWQTVTTKSRLNALCNEFAEGCYVFQKNFDWFLGDADGNVLPFPTEEFVTVQILSLRPIAFQALGLYNSHIRQISFSVLCQIIATIE